MHSERWKVGNKIYVYYWEGGGHYSCFQNLGHQRFSKKELVFSKSAITLSILIGLL
jgi:hypothetical protein